MKYIASLSFGKDSLAQIILIKRLGLPLDDVIYCDIRYTREFSGEMPEMARWIPTAEEILRREFGVQVRHLTAQHTFKDYFFRVKGDGKHKGEIYGFPFVIGAWCNSRLKVEVINKYLNSVNDDITEYIGIAYDEPSRYAQLLKKSTQRRVKRSVLYETKTTEDQAFAICEQYGLVSPLYKTGLKRGGCWFCVKQSVESLRHIWKYHPELWSELRELEKVSRCTIGKGMTLAERENKFIAESKQTSIFDFLEGGGND